MIIIIIGCSLMNIVINKMDEILRLETKKHLKTWCYKYCKSWYVVCFYVCHPRYRLSNANNKNKNNERKIMSTSTVQTFKTARRLLTGAHASHQLAHEMQQLAMQRPLLVSDRGVSEA